MNQCTHCGGVFMPKFANAKLCYPCWQKRETALADYDDLISENQRLLAMVDMKDEAISDLIRRNGQLITEINALRMNQALQDKPAQPALPRDMIQRLIRLAHPDKHAGSRLATEVTRWLLEQRRAA